MNDELVADACEADYGSSESLERVAAYTKLHLLSLSPSEENQFWFSDFMAGLPWKPESCGEARNVLTTNQLSTIYNGPLLMDMGL